MITKGYYNNEHLLKHQTYCPQLVAEQTFFSDFTIQSYSWIRMHQSAYDFFIHEYNVENIIPTVTSFIYYVKTLQWKKVLK